MTNNGTDNKENLENTENLNENATNGGEQPTQPDEMADAPVDINATEASEKPAMGAEEKLKAEVAELNDKYLRLYSEFENMRRRQAKERIELSQTAGKDILLSLLPVADDFERAMKSFEKTEDIAAIKDGIALIHNKFLNILSQKGLKPMDSVGKDFDVDFHEAITKIPAPSADMKGKVVDEVEKGYMLQDKVVRFAKVVVGE